MTRPLVRLSSTSCQSTTTLDYISTTTLDSILTFHSTTTKTIFVSNDPAVDVIHRTPLNQGISRDRYGNPRSLRNSTMTVTGIMFIHANLKILVLTHDVNMTSAAN